MKEVKINEAEQREGVTYGSGGGVVVLSKNEVELSGWVVIRFVSQTSKIVYTSEKLMGGETPS